MSKYHDIIKAGCRVYGVTEAELLGQVRKVPLAIYRHITAWKLVKSGCGLSTAGRLMGKHHTCILNSHRRVEAKRAAMDPDYLKQIDRLEHETDTDWSIPERVVGPDFRVVGFGTSGRTILRPYAREITPRVYVNRLDDGY